MAWFFLNDDTYDTMTTEQQALAYEILSGDPA